MGTRPILLFLSQCLPYPPHSGVTNRTFNILRQLQKEFDVTLFAFSRPNHQADARARDLAAEALERHGIRVAGAVPIRAATSLPVRAWDHARSVAMRKPYTYYEYESAELLGCLREWLSRNTPELVHVDSLDLYGWLQHLPDLPTCCTHHSIESELLRLRGDRIGSAVASKYIHHQAGLVEEVERRLCPDMDLNVMMSDLDGERLRSLAPGSRTVTVANGVDVEFMQPDPRTPQVDGRVLFLGPTYMFPNRDAVEYFLAESWEPVRSGYQGASLTLIGRSAPEDRERYGRSPAVSSEGYVDDVRPHIAAARCCIVPLRVGGGTRLKILDYWAMGKAVVSTSLGCEGLDTVDGENILIRDDPAEFAEAVVQVLSDPVLRRRLEENARRTAEESYSWDIIGEGMRNAYREILRPGLHRECDTVWMG
jgi:polysaccharide biosynthesis protein PslH